MKCTRLLCSVVPLLLGLAVGTAWGAETVRPNMLWLIAEDFSPHLGCYGEAQVATPHLDRLAREGVRYTRAYTTAPVCSASRSAFMTGMYQTSIGAHQHRTKNKSPLPEGVRTLPQWMREAGYFTANVVKLPNGFGFKGTGKTDWNFTVAGQAFQSSDWGDLKDHQPFYAQINFQETHRTFHAPPHADPAKVEIPPYYPDHPVTRKDWAEYLDAATALDVKVGKVLDQLEKDGLADHTIVVFFGDHGQAHVRGKQFCYEEGLRVPLIIRWPKSIPAPKQIRPGLVDARLLEAIDFCPTMLALAGAPKPAKMQGRIFLGDQAEAPRQLVFGARDRCDETSMRLRTVRDERYRYIRSFTPQVPLLAPNAYKERQYPVWNLLKELHAAGKLTPAQEFLCQPRMPEEQLYDLQTDPWEIDNLAGSGQPQHQAALKRLRAAVEQWIVDTDDQGRGPDPDAAPAGNQNQGAAQRGEKAKPNIIFILADDLGWRDLGCYGSTFYETPHLDRLAAQGMRFTEAYAACNVCSPTRASILTGKYPARLHLTDWLPGRPDRPDQKLKRPIILSQLPLEEVTMAEALKEAGYATAFLGKWHLGGEKYYPEHQGFDLNIGGCEKGHPPSYFSPYQIPNLPDGPKGEYLTDRLTEEALQFMESAKAGPFLIYLSHYAVHNPQQAKPALVEKYRAKLAGLPPAAGPEFITDQGRQVRQIQNKPVYAAMIQSLDESVGRILSKLVELRLDGNTIVFFTSDNGGLSTSEGTPTSNLPLRMGKGWHYEGGVREPLLVKWPGVTRPGSVCPETMISTDYYPTVLEMAGLPARPRQNLDGVSFGPLLRGGTRVERPLFWHYPHYSNQGGGPGGAVRLGPFKLIEWFEDMRVELYNVREDVGEQTDLAAKLPDQAASLRRRLHAWREEVDAQNMTPNPGYRPGGGSKPQAGK